MAFAIMAHRAGLDFETTIESDCAPLNGLIAGLIASGARVKALRDPTRGGLAATLNEFAAQAGLSITVDESAIPVKPEVFGACELLGLDPMNVANEGKLIAIVAAEDAALALEAMRAHPLGREAAIIGTAIEDAHHFVTMKSRIGGSRMVDWLREIRCRGSADPSRTWKRTEKGEDDHDIQPGPRRFVGLRAHKPAAGCPRPYRA